MSSSKTQQPVIFTTQSPYPLPTQKYLIPTTWKRFHLSQLVNKALSLATPIPFDFLVRGEILRTTLGEWCAQNGVGGEETLQIEYIESIMPPQKMSDIPHNDWVSSILCDLPGYLLTTSYDGHVRAFDYSQNLVASSSLHPAPITSMALVPTPSNEESSTHTIATASHDLTAAISRISLSTDPAISGSKTLATLHLHTAPVSSVASNVSGSHLLTSSWDGLIGLWDTTIPSADEIPEEETQNNGRERNKKRRKVAEDESKPPRKAPINVLKSHTARVSKVVFSKGEGGGGGQGTHRAYSCGFDSTVRVWDTEIGVSVHTITAAEKPFLSLAVSSDGRNALATSTDRTMMLYDLRSADQSSSSSSSITTATTSSFFHPATPSCIALSKNESQVATGAYDGVVRVWDLRSTKSAMTSFKAWAGNNIKVLDISWKRSIVGVAGEGGVEVWKVGDQASDNSVESAAP